MAELGDKTQLGVLSFTASSRSQLVIFAAASLALIAATSVGVLAGTILAKYINPRILQSFGGVLFIIIGIWILVKGD